MNRFMAFWTVVIVALVVVGALLITTSNFNNQQATGPTPTGAIGGAPPEETSTPGLTISPSQLSNDSLMEVNLGPIEGSQYNQSGRVTLTDENGRVRVKLDVNTVSELDNPQPAHIHTGACPNVGGIVFPLNDVVDGKSETVINTTIDDLRGQLPLAINIHKSMDEVNVYTSCGNLN